MKSKLSILIVIVLLLSFSIMAFAVVNNEKIEADMAHDMKFRLNGQMWQPKDVDGSVQAPIIYKGRSYVPVRSLLEENDVTVDFDNETRTIMLDFPAKRIDKSTPLIIKVVNSPDEGKMTKIIEVSPNKDFDADGIGFSSEISMDLAEDTKIILNGREHDLASLAKSREKIAIESGKVKLEYNPETKLISSIESGPTDTNPQALKVKVEIEISGPPWKIKITIRF